MLHFDINAENIKKYPIISDDNIGYVSRIYIYRGYRASRALIAN